MLLNLEYMFVALKRVSNSFWVYANIKMFDLSFDDLSLF
jgi:hypothetical protein